MLQREYSLTKLFDQFLKDSYRGKRLKIDGSRLKPQTIKNYEYVLTYLKEFEIKRRAITRIRICKGNNKRDFLAEKTYWKKFYLDFTNFLYNDKNCFDNYVGMVIKTIRTFFKFLNREMGIMTGDFYKGFYVTREDIPIITLLPGQLKFLINDLAFKDSLNKSLQKARSIFIFGCTVGLRVSDLFAIKFTDIESIGNTYYLPVKTIKTGKNIRLKLPGYVLDIVHEFRQTAKERKTIFPRLSPSRFNIQVKTIALLAGWTQLIPKTRNKRGKAIGSTPIKAGHHYRFCDLVSSHTMRRTAITTMLMLGMKEYVVKQVSGHTSDSKSFYRYVSFVQSYLDNEMDEVFNKLASIANPGTVVEGDIDCSKP